MPTSKFRREHPKDRPLAKADTSLAQHKELPCGTATNLEWRSFVLDNVDASPKSGKNQIFIGESLGSEVFALNNLNSAYIEASTAYLKEKSSLIDRVVAELAQHLVTAYRGKLASTQAQNTGNAEALPYFEIISELDPIQFETNLDSDTLIAQIRNLIEPVFEENRFWERGALEIWSSLVSWAIEALKSRVGDAPFAALRAGDFNEQIYQLLFEQDAISVQQRLSFLETFYAQTITRHIVDELNLPHYPISGLQLLLGLQVKGGKKIAPVAEMQLSTVDTIAAIPTGLPIISSISAQLQTELWQSDASGIAHFRYHSKSNLKNYLEHYITSPGDIETLPWEAAEQIINKFGFNTVKLQFILAAYAMKQTRPWESTFTLKATDIISELGWDKNHNTNMSAKRNEVASIAYALSCLLVKAVWVEGKGRSQVDASTPTGRMWEVLIDPHGQLDWTTGRIDAPDEIYITIRPGLWTAYFLNQAGSKAKESLYQFGYLALNILKLDPYHDELTLRLAIHLTLDVRIRARDKNPHDYKVKGLLDAVLPATTIAEVRQSSEKARNLFNRWNRALKLLANLGWQTAGFDKPRTGSGEAAAVFYQEPYPEWLLAETRLKKPRGWVEEWLAQKLVIKPPDPIPSRMATLSSPKARKQLKAEPLLPLSGERIKAARKEKGWTQAKLAGVLDVHQSLIAKIESGSRPVSGQIELSIRQILSL